MRALTDTEQMTLQRIARSDRERADHVARARALLAVADGAPFTVATAAAGVCSGDTLARCYTLLQALGYQVEQVNHGEGEYARGDGHENTEECEIGLLQQFLFAHGGISMATYPAT